MTQHYFETDKIQTVTLTQETEAGMNWYEERPEKIFKFLMFAVGRIPRADAGWAWDVNRERYSSDVIRKENPYLRIDEREMKVYNKAHVSIYFSYKHSLGCRFESNEEAQQYVDKLIEDSGRKFNVIIQ